MNKKFKREHNLQCPHCNKFGTLVKHGFRGQSGGPKRQQWICTLEYCGKTTCEPIHIKNRVVDVSMIYSVDNTRPV